MKSLASQDIRRSIFICIIGRRVPLFSVLQGQKRIDLQTMDWALDVMLHFNEVNGSVSALHALSDADIAKLSTFCSLQKHLWNGSQNFRVQYVHIRTSYHFGSGHCEIVCFLSSLFLTLNLQIFFYLPDQCFDIRTVMRLCCSDQFSPV